MTDTLLPVEAALARVLAAPRQRGLHEIVLADRGAAERHEHVGLFPLGALDRAL